MKVLCFGNPHLEGDSLSVKLGETMDVEGFTFEVCFYPEEIFSHNLKDTLIMDVVKNVRDVRVIEDIEDFAEHKTSTAHDLDLGYFLKLKKELGELVGIKVIALPPDMEIEDARKKVKDILDEL